MMRAVRGGVGETGMQWLGRENWGGRDVSVVELAGEGKCNSSEVIGGIVDSG